jgi:hypothetical protein
MRRIASFGPRLSAIRPISHVIRCSITVGSEVVRNSRKSRAYSSAAWGWVVILHDGPSGGRSKSMHATTRAAATKAPTTRRTYLRDMVTATPRLSDRPGWYARCEPLALERTPRKQDLPVQLSVRRKSWQASVPRAQ